MREAGPDEKQLPKRILAEEELARVTGGQGSDGPLEPPSTIAVPTGQEKDTDLHMDPRLPG
jgi:hypothetical protein